MLIRKQIGEFSFFNPVKNVPDEIGKEMVKAGLAVDVNSVFPGVIEEQDNPDNKCFYVFKSPECGYQGDEQECDKSFERCKQLGNIARWPGFPPIAKETKIVCPKCRHFLEKQPGEMAPLDYYCSECGTNYQLKGGQLIAVGGIVPQDQENVINFGMGRSIHIGSTKNIREYNEGRKVAITKHENGRWVIVTYNEGGYNSTRVDLQDIIDWVKVNLPQLLSDNGPKIDPSNYPVEVKDKSVECCPISGVEINGVPIEKIKGAWEEY